MKNKQAILDELTAIAKYAGRVAATDQCTQGRYGADWAETAAAGVSGQATMEAFNGKN